MTEHEFMHQGGGWRRWRGSAGDVRSRFWPGFDDDDPIPMPMSPPDADDPVPMPMPDGEHPTLGQIQASASGSGGRWFGRS